MDILIIKDNAVDRFKSVTNACREKLDLIDNIVGKNHYNVSRHLNDLKKLTDVLEWFNMELDCAHVDEIRSEKIETDCNCKE